MQLPIETAGSYSELLGMNDRNLAVLERELNVSVHIRGNEMTIEGDEEQVHMAETCVRSMVDILRRGEALEPATVRYLASLVRNGMDDRIQDILQDGVAVTYRGKPVKCRTLGQTEYVRSVRKNILTLAIGPAGTGKTFLAIAMAANALKNREIDRLILTRPAVEAGEKLGFLPGDMAQKVDPYLRPLYDALYEIIGPDSVQRLNERGTIEIAPLAFMRGRTLNNAFIILDEAQNATSEQMKMFLTRLGEHSKCVVTGDTTQIDLPRGRKSGLREAADLLCGIEDIGVIELTSADVVRHELVQKIVEAYQQRETIPSEELT